MTVFPQEPHFSDRGCTHNLTQTTENHSSQARVLGYYWVFLLIGHDSLSRVLPKWEHLVDTFALQVLAYNAHEHLRQSIVRLFVPFLSVFLEEAGQWTCTIPTSTTNASLRV
jgi:hypothetical protein